MSEYMIHQWDFFEGGKPPRRTVTRIPERLTYSEVQHHPDRYQFEVGEIVEAAWRRTKNIFSLELSDGTGGFEGTMTQIRKYLNETQPPSPGA
tara:strand:+ start:636 stop:914 length:279 start_codon:yes stop_codon:yes gene_type:complete